MRPAADAMAKALHAAPCSEPAIPVVANVSARPVTTAALIRDSLVAQVCGTVRWRESVMWLVEAGVTRFVEIGSGKVLTGLIKRIVPGVRTGSVSTPDEVAAFAESDPAGAD